MNNLPRQKLLEVVRRHGREIITEPRRCEGLMRDGFPSHRREISVLVSALEERIPIDLLDATKDPKKMMMPREALLARLAARLRDDVAMEAGPARWAVHTWALALGVLTQSQLDAIEHAEVRTERVPASGPEIQAPRTQPVTSASPIPDAPTPIPTPATKTRSSLPSAPVSLIVASDGSGDFPTLTDAIRRAPSGARLIVRPGIYNEGLVLDKPLDIIGDGALEEIIVRSTASSCLVMRSDEATVRNLTLRGQSRGGGGGGGGLHDNDGFFAVDIPRGRLLLDGCDISSDSLACVAIHNPEAAPLIRRCCIHHGGDSGVFAFDGARGSIEACDVFENANVGIAIAGGAGTLVNNCHIHHGSDAGLVVWGRASSIVEDCDIYANRLTNVGVSDGGVATLRRCRIHEGENTGVFTHRDGRALLEECHIYRHAEPEVAARGGGEVSLRGCRLYDGQSHGVFCGDAGSAALESCDVIRNRASGVRVVAGGGAVARGCRINDNGHVGVSCEAGGLVEIEDCDLTRNRVAAWETNHGSSVVSRRNRV